EISASIDFLPIFERLSSYDYEGWFVVEAEQDPALNPPLEMARKGHAALMQLMAQAEYSVAS
ncbi:myo-inosose-2 dehydratase, partial [Acetobacter cerevisiae]